MWKRPLCEITVGFLLGILSAVTGKKMIIPAAILMMIWMAAGSARYHRYLQGGIRILLFLVFFFLGSGRYQTETEFRKVYQEKLTEGMCLTIQGKLESKECKNNQYLYYLKDCYAVFSEGAIPCNQIIIYLDADANSIGEILVVRGNVEQWKTAVNEGNFDEKSFYESKKMDFKLKKAEILAVYGKKNLLREKLYELREVLKEVYRRYLNETVCGVLATMTLGDKSLLEEEIKTLYQKAGISHILAISGLHISLIGMSLYKLLRRIRCSYFQAGILSGGFMICYGFLSGFGTSTVRAVFMFSLMLLGQTIGRSYDSLSALGAACIFLLWENPFLIGYAGFLFSFSAVLGVVVIGKAVEAAGVKQKEIRQKKECSFPAEIVFKLKESLLMSFSIQLATVPLTAYFYYEIPLYAMPLNLLVLPLMSILLFLGLSGGVLGMFGLPGTRFFFFICHIILMFYQGICTVNASLPNASVVVGKPGVTKMILFYLLLMIFVLWMRVKKSRKGFVTIGILLFCFLFYRPQGSFELDVLDVGQGDGCYLHTESGIHLFVDGGSTDVSKAGKYRILPFLKSKGVKGIDYWLISHTDQDHISGLIEILESDYPVGSLIFSKEIIKDEIYENLVLLAEEHGTEILFLQQGDKIHLGEGVLTCLYPGENDRTNDKNAMSLVVLYEEEGFSGIFTGDIGVEEEKKIAESGNVPKVLFYKAAHHGSNGSNSTGFLNVLTPGILTVSCGENNSYGHPGKDAVARMEMCGGKVFYTMESGQIQIRKENGKIIVRKYCKMLDVSSSTVIE